MAIAGLNVKGWSSLKKLFLVHLVRRNALLYGLNILMSKSDEWISTTLKGCDKINSKDVFESTELFGISWIGSMHKNQAHN